MTKINYDKIIENYDTFLQREVGVGELRTKLLQGLKDEMGIKPDPQLTPEESLDFFLYKHPGEFSDEPAVKIPKSETLIDYYDINTEHSVGRGIQIHIINNPFTH